jgi:predicted metal-binding transcription factor (methanogenesis marker protein 9)
VLRRDHLAKLDLLDFSQVISELKDAIAQEQDERERRRLERLLPKFESLRTIEMQAPKTNTAIKKAMSVTCYRSLAYCCGLAKNCVMRDGCRRALGIDDTVYVEVKERMLWEMLKHLELKPMA